MLLEIPYDILLVIGDYLTDRDARNLKHCSLELAHTAKEIGLMRLTFVSSKRYMFSAIFRDKVHSTIKCPRKQVVLKLKDIRFLVENENALDIIREIYAFNFSVFVADKNLVPISKRLLFNMFYGVCITCTAHDEAEYCILCRHYYTAFFDDCFIASK